MTVVLKVHTRILRKYLLLGPIALRVTLLHSCRVNCHDGEKGILLVLLTITNKTNFERLSFPKEYSFFSRGVGNVFRLA